MAATEAGACRHHLTAAERKAERERIAESHRQRVEALRVEERRLDRRMRWIIISMISVGLTVIPWVSWQFWQDLQAEAACDEKRQSQLKERQEADTVHVPVLGDPVANNSPTAEYIPEFDATEDEIKETYAERRQLLGKAASIIIAHPECFASEFVSEARKVLEAPKTVRWVDMPEPPHCADGWPSSSIGERGACSHHGGVVRDFYATLHF